MKRLFAMSFILVTLLATSQAHALTWNWSFDELAGTLTTDNLGTPYESGTYTVTDFSVDEVGFTGFPTGSISDGPWSIDPDPSVSTFSWNQDTQSVLGLSNSSPFTFRPRLPFVRRPEEGQIFFLINFIDPNSLSSMPPGPIGQAIIFDFDTSETIFSVFGDLSIAPVPVPAAAWLFMTGLIGLVVKGRKVRSASIA